MKRIIIESEIRAFKFDELSQAVRSLVDAARDATSNSYTPYSKFNVGAAVRLEDGTIIKGANQENAAFPVTMCAYRQNIPYGNQPLHALSAAVLL